MRSTAVLAAALLVGIAAPAGANCKCRARGIVASEGQTLCIPTPDGARLARCGKVSNVASWTFLDGPCLQAAADPHSSRALPERLRRSFATR